MKTERLQSHWASLPEAEIKSLQLAKLRHYLKQVVLPFSEHYREVFSEAGITADDIRTFEDWQRVPFTSKEDLVATRENPQQPRRFILVPDRAQLVRRPATLLRGLVAGRARVTRDLETEFRPIFMTSTTGRSAEPVPFLYTGHDIANLRSAGKRLFEVCGATRDMKLLNLFPYAPHLAFWQTHHGAETFGVFMLSTGGGKVMGTEGNLRVLQRIQPDVIIGMPTFVYHVLHQAVENGATCPNLRRLVLGGEKVPDGMRRKLAHLAAKLGAESVDVVATYGFTEAKTAWAECPAPKGLEPTGYHLYPDQGFFEVIDPATGRPSLEGEPGELVYTSLGARGSVVLRYRTGDLIEHGMTHEPCPLCGRRVPRLLGRISRVSEQRTMRLEKLKGTLVDFNDLEHVLDDAPGVGAWQIELRKRDDDPLEVDELVLHLDKLNGESDDQLRRDVSRRLVEATEVRPNRIEFHTAREMQSLQGVGRELKEQKLVDHRPNGDSAEPKATAEERPLNGGIPNHRTLEAVR